MAQIRDLDDVVGQFLSSMSDFLSDAVTGSGVRLECVLSGKNSSDVISLLSTYGSRMVQFCLSENLLLYSSKNWPYYIDSRITAILRKLKEAIDIAHTVKLDRNVLADIYDFELILRFHVFGESQFLDSNRLSVLFPCRQIVPGRRRKSRRDDDGFVRYNPSAVGFNIQFHQINLFGHVPIGPYVRKDLTRSFGIVTADVLSCCPFEVSWVVSIV
ncbi:uncharacterized protein LOC126552150 [Aphis gossypii]|uniref:uncharacterized protein LOC126552095 n=1 Tax=Aphis gossypii TaxID=80765 RepID=UPI0021594111|nr:uncharacterized protein LOC126552095 [Aphis gossypii]XP_050062721.1 uncharacterized protein LOC126552150 [Aphis gossypii]